MPTQDYLALFFPFEKLDIQKKGTESRWNLSAKPLHSARSAPSAPHPSEDRRPPASLPLPE